MKTVNEIFFWIFIVIIGIVCLVCLITSTVSFTYSQLNFSEYFTATAEKIGKQEYVKDNIDYLEKLQTIQKSAASNDLMSFIYTLLSTIMIGVCAGFVVKSNASAIEAKDSADKAKGIKNQLKEFSNRLLKAENDNKDTLAKIEFQQVTFEVMSVMIAILNAREELRSSTAKGIEIRINVRMNEHIKVLYIKVKALTSEDNQKLIRKIQIELLRLKTMVKEFRNIVLEESQGDMQESHIDSADLYNKQLTEAIAHCDKLLASHRHSVSS